MIWSLYSAILSIITMFWFVVVIIGEGANFAAYAYAPAILVTPLGALSIIFRYAFIMFHGWWCYSSQKLLFSSRVILKFVCIISHVRSAVLAHFILEERLHIFGVVGCILCLVGSTSIVLHAPLERKITSVKEIWYLATEPGMIFVALGSMLNILFNLCAVKPCLYSLGLNTDTYFYTLTCVLHVNLLAWTHCTVICIA